MTPFITFNASFSLGSIIKEETLFTHKHFASFLDLYDANFIQFNTVPSLAKFQQIEDYLMAFHQKNGQSHLKFKFPENVSFSNELNNYLTDSLYTTDVLELFILNKHSFPKLPEQHLIEVKKVTSDSLNDLLTLRYTLNKEYGTDYAKRKNQLITEQLKNSDLTFLIAYYNNQPAGCLNLIETYQTVEIDDLFVSQHFRNKKIASYLQQAAIQLAKEKTVFLIANADDTPRNMYLKQGYQLHSTRSEIFKTI